MSAQRTLSGVLCLVLSGCATVKSSYVPTTAMPGELVWQYTGDMALQKDGRNVQLSRLAEEVTCVPESVRDAKEGNDLTSSGRAWSVVGLTTLLLGMAGGVTLLALGLSEDNDDLLYAGLGTAGGGLVLGLTFTGVGLDEQIEGHARRLDAVNRYNDFLWFGTSCKAAGDAAVTPLTIAPATIPPSTVSPAPKPSPPVEPPPTEAPPPTAPEPALAPSPDEITP